MAGVQFAILKCRSFLPRERRSRWDMMVTTLSSAELIHLPNSSSLDGLFLADADGKEDECQIPVDAK
jgi:hypothetical protein